MKSIYTEQAEVGEAINRVKDNQDKVLDMYDPTNAKLKKLMLELVQLEKELEDLDEEFEALRKTLWYEQQPRNTKVHPGPQSMLARRELYPSWGHCHQCELSWSGSYEWRRRASSALWSDCKSMCVCAGIVVVIEYIIQLNGYRLIQHTEDSQHSCNSNCLLGVVKLLRPSGTQMIYWPVLQDLG